MNLAQSLVVLGIGVLDSVALYDRLRDPKRYSAARMDALALVALACGQLGILYVGAFSAAPLMVALGLYFFCRTEHTASAIAIYVIAAGAHAIEAALVIGGVIEDPGFYPVGRHVSVHTIGPPSIAGRYIPKQNAATDESGTKAPTASPGSSPIASIVERPAYRSESSYCTTHLARPVDPDVIATATPPAA